MRWVFAISLIAFVMAIVTIDAAGNLSTFEGPGVTLDESFNVSIGWYIVHEETRFGLGAISPLSQLEIFGYEGYNPDHPPLGRLFLGISDAIVRSLVHPDLPAQNTVWSITAARFAAAFFYACTVLLVGVMTWRWCDKSAFAGAAAALIYATIPRVFGHAHIASLEAFINLTFAATVFYLADRCTQSLTNRDAAVAGFLWGLALLTKIQAVLIPIPFAVWALWHYRQRAIIPGAAFGIVGFATFFAGWPWLWIDPVDHILEYFGRGSDRIELNVFFGGQSYGDRHVPLLYTIVTFLVTTPLLWHLFGFAGCRLGLLEEDAAARRRWQLIAGVVGFVLVFFSLPNIAVYDGARLFLVCHPLWSCLAGFGAFRLWQRYSTKLSVCWRERLEHRSAAVAAITLAFASLWVGSPYWLSHYSMLVGGLPGASRLGFETTYWGDSLTRGFWNDAAEQLPEGAVVEVSPVLHQFQLDVLESQYPAIEDKGIRLIPYGNRGGGESAVETRYVVAFRRRADIPDEIETLFAGDAGSVLTEKSSWGVRLALLAQVDRDDVSDEKQ